MNESSDDFQKALDEMVAVTQQHHEDYIKKQLVSACAAQPKQNPITLETLAEVMQFLGPRRFVGYVVRPDIYENLRVEIPTKDNFGGWGWGVPVYSKCFQAEAAWRFGDEALMRKYLRDEINEGDLKRILVEQALSTTHEQIAKELNHPWG